MIFISTFQSLAKSFGTAAALYCASALASKTPSNPTPVRMVANNHTVYQGTTAPRTIKYVGNVTVDSAGLASFVGTFDIFTYGVNDSSVWSERGGAGLQEIVHTGDADPPTVAPYHYNVAISQSPVFAEDTFAFRDEFPNTPGNHGLGVWVSVPGHGLRLVATSKSNPEIVAPRVVIDTSSGLFYTNVTSQGYIGLNWFRNFVYESLPDNTLRNVVSQFDPVPGVTGSTYFDVGNERVNDSGQIAWDGSINTSSTVNSSNFLGIWKELSLGNKSLVVRSGSIAPGTPNLPFNRFPAFSLNNDGSVPFLGAVSNPDPSINVGIWRDIPSGGIQPIMVEGDPAPGTGAGVKFGNIDRFMHAPTFDPSGNMIFASNLIGPGVDSSNDSGLWEYNGQNLRLVTREGQPAPGAEPGVVFDALDNQQWKVNSKGQIAFWAQLRGPGIDSTNNSGIWAEGPQGLTLIARSGDYYTDGDGQVFRIGTPTLNSLSSTGYIGFWAYDYDDSSRSAAYVSNLVAIPEPRAAFLVFSATAAAPYFRFRSRPPARCFRRASGALKGPRGPFACTNSASAGFPR